MSKLHLNYLFILFSLSLLGVLGNYISLPLFFGVDFIFGSIAVLMATRLLGMAGAVTVALIAGTYTYFIWGHPYAMIIFSAEAIVLGLLLRWKISSLVLADIIFWLVVGMPLIWLFYSSIMGMDQTQALLILLKQPVNGVTNAIIATYLLLLIPDKYILKIIKDYQGQIQLKELLFNTLLGITLAVSLIIIIVNVNSTKNLYESVLSEQLHQYLDRFEIIHSSDNSNEIKNDDRLDKYKFDVVVVSAENAVLSNTLAASELINFRAGGSSIKLNENLFLWQPERNELPFMLWWNKAYYFISRPFQHQQGNKIYLLQSTRVIISKIQTDILMAFQLLFSLTIFGGLFAYIVSRKLTRTIVNLTETTKNLPEKIKNNLKIEWPSSKISELSQLSRQAENISNNIRMSFDEVSIHAKTIFEASMDSIITIDDNDVVQGFNHAAEILFGYRREEIIGNNINILAPESEKGKSGNSLNELISKNRLSVTGKRIELSGKCKDGREVPIELSVTKTVFNNKVQYTGIITDITERKINEKLKRDFISTVSHELRTPLTSINGAIKLLRSQNKSMDSEQSELLFDVTSRNIDRLSTLINDLLDFEKLDSSGIKYEKDSIRVKDLIAGVVEQTHHLAEQKNIELCHFVEQEYEFIADFQRVSQILVNLISNAIKFSPENKTVEIGCTAEDGMINLFVKDCGAGISEEFKNKIFERFTQADSADNRQIQRGTGLGLAISKSMTEGMGGRIGFNSTEGQGSTFFIIFPLTIPV